ncbi:MAG: ATP-binding protein, partial [Coriobacteriales bacterium]|nr:ATP-binding protein [Coriobacteriales bacterium]
MITRVPFSERLQRYRDTHLIKVVTGVRRCGKTTLLEMFKDTLLAEGIMPAQIQFIDFEDPDAVGEGDWRTTYHSIAERLAPDVMNYLFLNEPQLLDGFEHMVDGLFIKKNVDLYLTGSNSRFLSSELATLLTGRYVEIHLLPFSFREYLESVKGTSSPLTQLSDYLMYGGFPQAVELFAKDPDLANEYLRGIYHTVLVKDVLSRQGIGSTRALEAVARFILDNIGNTTTPRRIAGTMTSSGRAITNHTVENYLHALAESYIIYPVERFDIKGKQLLRSQQKFYCADLGLRRIVLGRRPGQDIGHILENAVYLELLRRGNDVKIGKAAVGEIDFVTTSPTGDISYYQVAYTARESSTLERELKTLKTNDDYPKYLITMDPENLDFNGIKKVNAVEF